MTALVALIPFLANDRLFIRARAARAVPGALTFEYEISGEIPASSGQAGEADWSETDRRDGLWRTTCFEAFVARPGEPGYWEFNFSDQVGWNVYRFSGQRQGMGREPGALGVRRQRTERSTHAHWRFEVRMSSELARELAGPLDVSLAAVMESADGRFSHWALAHACAAPDFHARAGFRISLGADGRTGEETK